MKIESIDIHDIPGGQAIQLPEGFRINDNKVYLKKTGNVVHIIPFHTPWESFFESLEEFTPDFMDNRDEPTEQKRGLFD